MRIVVTGATGNVGRPLVAHLVAAGAHVRAVTRSPDTAGFPDAVEAIDSVADALPGASAVFLNSRALGDGMADFVARCAPAGVTKLVALSAINCDDDVAAQPSRFRGDRNREAEQYAVESGLAWVSLRPSVFASSFVGMWATQIRSGDVIAGPYAAASAAPVADSDISAVAARALLTDDLIGRRIPITGPHALTNSDLVEIVGTVLRRPLQYREITPELVRQRFVGLGFPDEFGTAYIAMLAQTLDVPALVTHEVEKILRRPPLTFAQWVSRNRALFTATHDV